MVQDFTSNRLDMLLKKLARRRQDKVLLRVLKVFCGGVEFERLVEDFKNGRRDIVYHYGLVLEAFRDKAPKTVKFYMGLLNKALRVMGISVDLKMIRELLDIPKTYTVKTDRAPTKDELRRILNHSTPRNRLLFMMMAVCGLRLSEVLRIKVGDLLLNEDPPMVRIISAKSGHVRLVPLTSELVTFIRDYLGKGRHDPREYLFHPPGRKYETLIPSDIQQYFYSTLRKADLLIRDSSGKGYEIHIHSLRKFFKTQLENAGVNTLLIEKWMGHNIGSIAHTYYKPSEDVLKNEFKKFEEALTIFSDTSYLQKYDNLERRLLQLQDIVYKMLGESKLLDSKLFEKVADTLLHRLTNPKHEDEDED